MESTAQECTNDGNLMKIKRGAPHKRGHQHHVRFSGDRCSKLVNAAEIIAALHAGYYIPMDNLHVTSFEIEPQKITDTKYQAAQSTVMKDPFKLAWFETGFIDPDIVREKCERFGVVKHCRQFRGVSFPLFSKPE